MLFRKRIYCCGFVIFWVWVSKSKNSKKIMLLTTAIKYAHENLFFFSTLPIRTKW